MESKLAYKVLAAGPIREPAGHGSSPNGSTAGRDHRGRRGTHPEFCATYGIAGWQPRRLGKSLRTNLGELLTRVIGQPPGGSGRPRSGSRKLSRPTASSSRTNSASIFGAQQ